MWGYVIMYVCVYFDKRLNVLNITLNVLFFTYELHSFINVYLSFRLIQKYADCGGNILKYYNSTENIW